MLLKINNAMKNRFFLFFSLIIFLHSCAQQKTNKPPKFPPKDYGKIKKAKSLTKPSYFFNLGELKKNSDSLYCLEIDTECHLINGKSTLNSYYQTSGDDNPKLLPYTLAEGEFLEGKYQGIWKYYDKNGKVIKKDKWENGKLIYRKEYK